MDNVDDNTHAANAARAACMSTCALTGERGLCMCSSLRQCARTFLFAFACACQQRWHGGLGCRVGGRLSGNGLSGNGPEWEKPKWERGDATSDADVGPTG